ncbi:MAG: hypothetical protein Kow0031_37130 [Anaerolineae bacterium]
MKARFLLLIFVLLLSACNGMTNYEDESGPLFSGEYAPAAGPFNGTLKVVSWNIKFAEEIEAAIEALQSEPALQNADILLLQEMDETGVEAVARALALNYIYFPASVHTHHGKNFGNAVLSRWPLSEPAKLVLPYQNPKNQQRRIAVRAIAQVAAVPVLAYSIHTETVWLPGPMRREQVLSLVESLPPNPPHVVVGGDFNTATDAAIVSLDELLAEADLVRVSAGSGPTVTAAGLEFTLDHIYARDFAPLQTGVVTDTAASDHAAVWVGLKLP